jgi:hypothetical protein
LWQKRRAAGKVPKPAMAHIANQQEPTMITEKTLKEFQEYMRSGKMGEDFECSGEERRMEMLDLLEMFMDVAEIADETATKLIFKNSQLGEMFGEGPKQ